MNMFYYPIVWTPLLVSGLTLFLAFGITIPIKAKEDGCKAYLWFLLPMLLFFAGLYSFDGFNDLQIEEKCSQKCINLINNRKQ